MIQQEIPESQDYKYLKNIYDSTVAKFKDQLIDIDEAATLLQELLQNPLMNDEPFDSLRCSALISLGQIHTRKNDASLALEYFQHALDLLQREEQGPIMTQSKSEKQFKLIIKMFQVSQKFGMQNKQIQLLKLAITKAPPQYKHGLQMKLKQLWNNDQIRELQFQEEQPDIMLVQDDQVQKKQEGQGGGNYIPKIKIRINLFKQLPQYQHYNIWEKILAIAYILLKFKSERPLTNKNWLSKWSCTADWRELQKKFDHQRTGIQLSFYEQENSNLMNELADYEQEAIRFGNILRSAAEFMLLERHQTEQECFKKYQWHYRYPSISQYLSETMRLRGFNPSYLLFLSKLNSESFNSTFGQILIQQQTQQNPRQNSLPSHKLITALRPKSQQKFKIIEGYARHNQYLIEILKIGISAIDNDEDNFPYSNCMVMVQRMAGMLITQAATADQPENALLSTFALRSILNKTLLLVLQSKQNAFQEITSSNVIDQNGILSDVDARYLKRKGILLELCNIKIEQLSMKTSKNQQFEIHQNKKLADLQSFASTKILAGSQFNQHQINEMQDDQIHEYSYFLIQKLRFHCLTSQLQQQVNQTKNKIVTIHSKFLQLIRATEIDRKQISDTIDIMVRQFKKRAKSQKIKDEENSKQISVKQKLKTKPEYKQISSLKNYFKDQPDLCPTGTEYIQKAIKLLEYFFSRVSRPGKQLLVSNIQTWAELGSIKSAVEHLCEQFKKDDSIKSGLLPTDLYSHLLMDLVKLYLLSAYEQNDNAMRIIFYITGILLKTMPDLNQQLIPASLLLFHSLIKYKQFSRKLLANIRKKMYFNFVSRNIEQLLALTPSNHQSQNSTVNEEQLAILLEIFTGLQFEPKRTQDVLGFFALLFKIKTMNKSITLPSDRINKIAQQCSTIYEDKKYSIHTFCQQFLDTMKLFGSVLYGEGGTKSQANLLNILKGNTKICECCANLKENSPLHYFALVSIAQYHQKHPFVTDTTNLETTSKFSLLDEIYRLTLLLLVPRSSEHWEGLIRCNMLKVIRFYASLAGRPLDELRRKVQSTSKLIQLARTVIPQNKKLAQCCDYQSELLGALRMRERQYRMCLKDLQGAGMSTSRDSKQSIKKYKEGLKRSLSQLATNPKSDVRIRALRVLQFKLKLAWVSIEKEYKQDDKKDAVIIELEDYMSPEQKVFKPNKIKQHLLDVIAEVKQIIRDLRKDPRPKEVEPLQEQLIVQMYAFLFRSLEWKLEKIINRLCEVIRVSSKTDQCRKLKEMQFTFNEVEFTTSVLVQPDFLSRQERYRLRPQKLVVSITDTNTYEVLFQNTFAPRPEPEMELPRQTLRQFLRDKYGSPRDRLGTIEVESETHSRRSEDMPEPYHSSNSNRKTKDGRRREQDKGPWEYGFMDRRVPGQHRGRVNFNPEVHIDVGKYFYQRLKQYMLDNESAATRFNAIHSVIGSFSFYKILQILTKIMQELHRVLCNIGRAAASAHNPRALALALWTNSQIVLRYSGNWQKARELVQDVFDLGSIDIVDTELGQSAEIPLLGAINRCSIVEQMHKKFYLEHLFRIFAKGGDKEAIIELLNRLNQLSRGKTPRGLPRELQTANIPALESKPIELKFYFFMFEVGTTYFVDALKKDSIDRQIPDRYEQYLLYLRDQIKSRVGREETNFYYNRLEEFRDDYQIKFQKKIKSRRPKETEIDTERQTKRQQSSKQEERKTKQKKSKKQKVKVQGSGKRGRPEKIKRKRGRNNKKKVKPARRKTKKVVKKKPVPKKRRIPSYESSSSSQQQSSSSSSSDEMKVEEQQSD